MRRDNIYNKPLNPVDAFRFDQKVVDVFPDMIRRSVPGYGLIIEQIGMLTRLYAKPDCNYYDLGSSLGAATQAMQNNIFESGCRIYAIDNSREMIDESKKNIKTSQSNIPVDFICSDIRDVDIKNAQIIVFNFTLQFISPEQRNEVLKKIWAGMNTDGILLLSEKSPIISGNFPFRCCIWGPN